jgi:hypothetical protein
MELLFETEVGEYAEFEGQKVPLDFPMIEEISFVIPDAEATWQQASTNPQIQKMGEEQWKKLSDISKAAGGFGYTAKYTDIDPVMADPSGEEVVTFSDDDQIQMPVVLKYEEAGTVKYEIVAGEDVLSSLISSGTDTDPDIWVVDITSEKMRSRGSAPGGSGQSPAWPHTSPHRPMKNGPMRAGMSLCFARRHQPARRAIPTPAIAGRVGDCRGWYQIGSRPWSAAAFARRMVGGRLGRYHARGGIAFTTG